MLPLSLFHPVSFACEMFNDKIVSKHNEYKSQYGLLKMCYNITYHKQYALIHVIVIIT